MALTVDTHLELVPLVDEDPHGYVMSYNLEHFDSGHVRGDLEVPEGRDRELFHWHLISSELPIYPVFGSLRALLDYYWAGGQLRVYRNYPTNVTAWDDSGANDSGYSDVVPQEAQGQSLPWFNMGMTIFSFDLDGVALR